MSINTHRRRDELNLLWYMSKKCNYDCVYCSDALHSKNSRHLTERELQLALRNFSSSKFKKINLALSGGEPFLHPDIKKILIEVKSIPDKLILTNVTTNGSLPTDHYLECLPYLNSMTVSAHLAYLKPEIFLKKLELLQANCKFKIQVNVMFTPGKMELAKFLIIESERIGTKPILRRVRKKDSAESSDYSLEELEYFKYFYQTREENQNVTIEEDTGSELVFRKMGINSLTAQNLNNFKGWMCDAGSVYFTIWTNGKIYPCESGLMKKHSMGDFYEESFQWPTQDGQRCPIEKCVCTNDIWIPKRVAPPIGQSSVYVVGS